MTPNPWRSDRPQANRADDGLADAAGRGASGSLPAAPLQRLPGGAMGCPLCGPSDQRLLREPADESAAGRGPGRTDGGRPGRVGDGRSDQPSDHDGGTG